MKTYSTRFNAARAAAKIPGATVERMEKDSLPAAYYVMLPAAAPEGVDEPAADDVPSVQLEAPEPAPALVIALPKPYVEVAAPDSAFSAPLVKLFAAPPAPVQPVPVGLTMMVQVAIPADQAGAVAQFLANKYGAAAEVVNPVTGNVLQGFSPVAKAVKAAGAVKAPSGKAAAIEAAARAGVMPTPPDFSASTHKPYRKKLAELVALCESGSVAAVLAFAIKGNSTSPRALIRYRTLAAIAMVEQKAA